MEATQSGGPSFRGNGAPIRALVVDDSKDVVDSLSAALESRHGIAVVGRAHNGRQAIDLVASLDPELVLMDLLMPVMNGVEAIRELRGSRPGLRIIAMSVDEYGLSESALGAGADAFIPKSAMRRGLAKELERLFGAPVQTR
jgi:DNA-binding NarL/FixJ family response regulator